MVQLRVAQDPTFILTNIFALFIWESLHKKLPIEKAYFIVLFQHSTLFTSKSFKTKICFSYAWATIMHDLLFNTLLKEMPIRNHQQSVW